MPVQPLVQLCNRLEVIETSRGLRGLIDFVKAVRLNLINYLSGNKERDPLCKCTKDGIPIILCDLIPLIREKSYIAISKTFTVLYCTRSLKLKASPDIDSIIQP